MIINEIFHIIFEWEKVLNNNNNNIRKNNKNSNSIKKKLKNSLNREELIL